MNNSILGYDIAVIGGGHNGLVAANYLVDHGFDVVLIDASPRLGGAIGSHTSSKIDVPVPAGANWAGMLSSKVASELKLADHGHVQELAEPQLYCIYPDGAFAIHLDQQQTKDSLSNYFGSAKVSREIDAYEKFCAVAADLLREEFETSSPSKQRFEQNMLVFSGIEAVCECSIEQILGRFFSDEKIIGAFAFAPVSLSNSLLCAPGTAYSVFHMMLAELNEKSGCWGFFKGGTQSLVDVLTSRLQSSARCETLLNSPVSRISKDGGVFKISSGAREIRVAGVVSSLPLEMMLRICPNDPPANASNVQREEGKSGQVWFFTRSLPDQCVDLDGELAPNFRGIIQLAPSVGLIVEAFETFLANGVSDRPLITCSIHRVNGGWLVSCYVQFVKYTASTNINRKYRTSMIANVQSFLEEILPGFTERVNCADGLTPRDMELSLNLPFGHPEHGDMNLGAIFEDRGIGVADLETCKTLVPNLYLCGASVHPGGNVTGMPGRLAAQTLIKEFTK